MSVSPRHQLDAQETDLSRHNPYFSMIPNSKDRLLEQKRAEHEHARLEHRRRFEEQMQILETKQQRDEAILNGVEEEQSPLSRIMPITPIRTPGHGEARSKVSLTAKTSPPIKVFETRHSANEQLVTPPSDYLNRSVNTFGPGRSMPGSRRTSSNIGFENLNISDVPEQRRSSYIDQSRPLVEGSRPALPATSSYLQMNTTDDSFPILVRRDSHAPAATTALAFEGGQDLRNSNASAYGAFERPTIPRAGSHGPLDEYEAVRSRGLSDSANHAAQRGFNGNQGYLGAYETTRRTLPDFSTMAAGRHAQSSMLPQDAYAPYGLGTQAGYGQKYPNFAAAYGTNAPDLQRVNNAYMALPRPPSFNKRSADDANRYADVALETLVGDIYSLCKDQHGCRYLQKKLDERNPTNVDIIFEETHIHASELMIDPFGNYLCQKLLEHCDADKRLKIVQTVAPDLVNISLNMHGTRAVQKLIEFLTTPEQIRIATEALSVNAVTLIKDLNGNHVIQKCLNRLGSTESQFIFDAVSKHCVEVATHRHGCCVLQRCIDHASEAQKVQVIAEINSNAPALVQDPFGNYVVQYVLDLGDQRFSTPLIRRFVGSVCTFSTQKFSSNVIEKCLRVAEPSTRALLIDELLHKARLEKLLRDSFANYVIQTALDYAEAKQRQQLIDCIRPLLPAIRATPYGRRIQSKISGNTPPAGPAGNFSYAPQIAGFPGYGFRMPPVSVASQTYAGVSDFQRPFKSDFDF